MTNIDETELARLERLKEDSDNNRKVYGGDTIATVWYQREAANAVPALIAEIRGLREKVEAWEWLFEVEGLFRHFTNRKSYWRVRSGAYDELAQSLIAAREAVHADRE